MIQPITEPTWLETPRGGGWAKYLIDYGIESSLYWVVFLETGEVWRFAN